jgi:protein TonB
MSGLAAIVALTLLLSAASGWFDVMNAQTAFADIDLPAVPEMQTFVAEPVQEQETQQPIRVGGAVGAPTRTKYVAPVYPERAADANVSGIVIAEAVVDPAGRVVNVKVLKSIPLLDEAAIRAIEQWEYTPTTMNGKPVSLVLTVTVRFNAGIQATEKPLPSAQETESRDLAANPISEFTAWNGKPVRLVGGEIKAPERSRYVNPEYPIEALRARVSGVVIVQAVIDENGNVVETKILKGIELLNEAALNAVAQWKYVPTLLNGEAVPVAMTVTVAFDIRR